MPDPMKVFASTTRGMLVPAPTKKLLALDYAGIESRVTAWLAGEAWKLQAFRDFDAGTGPDTYKLAYARSFQVPVETIGKDDPRRQIGKVMELALGYEGGVGAFVTMTKTYNVDLAELTRAALPIIPDDVREKSEFFLSKGGGYAGLPHDQFIVCDSLKRLWRNAHPKIAALWRDMRDAALCAVNNPGKTYSIPSKLIMYRVMGDWLYMRLPSGRKIAYYKPEVHRGTIRCPECAVTKEFMCPVCNGVGTLPDHSEHLTYMGVDTDTRRWMRVSTYGGRLVQNAGEGTPRDLLINAMFGMEAAGLPVIMTVHDEIVMEVDDEEGLYDKALGTMVSRPKWAEGLPVAAEGWIGPRFRK